MSPIISQINLIRYLIVWQAAGPFVQLPRQFAADISRTLGALIAESLPTQHARPWRKAAEAWGLLPGAGEIEAEAASPPARAGRNRPTAAGARQRSPSDGAAAWPAWPIQAVIWPYPGKRAYGQGEPIIWELKLLGDDADHGLFLEVILPAMEAAATTTDGRWYRQRTLWGRFDIQSIFVSRGPRWEPIVRDRRLDLDYRVTSIQWAEGLTWDAAPKRGHRRLAWLTPFDLRIVETDSTAEAQSEPDRSVGLPRPRLPRPSARTPAPTLREILDTLMARVARVALGKRATADQAWALLPPEEQAAVWQDCEAGRLTKVDLRRSDRDAPGQWIGEQSFVKIPPRLWPYLDLAATLHIGQHTHFGCGAFTIM